MSNRRASNNMGSVGERKDGRWEGRVSLPDGRRRCVYGRTEKEVVDKMQSLFNDIRQGTVREGKDQALGAYMEDWLANFIEPTRSPSTTKNYAQMLRLYIAPKLGRIKLSKLTGQDIQRFLNQLRQQPVARTGRPMSPRTTQLCYGILSAALNRARKLALINQNPCAAVDPPKGRRTEVRPLTPEQARALLASVRGSRLEGFWTIAISCGLRPAEGLGLRWADVDFEKGTIFVRQQLQADLDGKLVHVDLKTKKSRRLIHLPTVTLRALKAHRVRQRDERMRAEAWEDNDLVFCTEGRVQGKVGGRPLYHRNVFTRLQKVLVKAELPQVNLYNLRHTAASLLLAQGASMREVMEVLGHSQMSLTSDTYSHVYEAAGKANAERMNCFLDPTFDNEVTGT